MRIFLFLLSMTIFGCQADVMTGDGPETLDEPDMPGDVLEDGEVSAINLSALDLINEQRRRGCVCGNQAMPAVAELSAQTLLVRTADLHSLDMANRMRMGHDGSDGSTVGERLSRQGYNWRRVAENVAFGHTSLEQVIQAWFNSAGHCRNLMHADLTHFGMSRQGRYWTQVFATPL